jgi:hypothetical protein
MAMRIKAFLPLRGIDCNLCLARRALKAKAFGDLYATRAADRLARIGSGRPSGRLGGRPV